MVSSSAAAAREVGGHSPSCASESPVLQRFHRVVESGEVFGGGCGGCHVDSEDGEDPSAVGDDHGAGGDRVDGLLDPFLDELVVPFDVLALVDRSVEPFEEGPAVVEGEADKGGDLLLAHGIGRVRESFECHDERVGGEGLREHEEGELGE